MRKNVVILCGAILLASVLAWLGHAFMAAGQYHQIRQVAMATLENADVDYRKLGKVLHSRDVEIPDGEAANNPQTFGWAIAKASQGWTPAFVLPMIPFVVLTILFGVLWINAEARGKERGSESVTKA